MVTSEFLLPIIDSVKVTQYGSEATVVVTGQRLWFAHSLHLSTLLKEPFQVQKESISFCARINDIMVTNKEDKEVTLFSYLATPVKKRICVELDVSLKF
ncbi:MAG: hypothetical protein MJE68_11940 [Proteobacteria bacterium]|nr:hypothetical protein [Pseudomonadota bacterium]